MTWPFAARIVGPKLVCVRLNRTAWLAAATKDPVAPESRMPNLIGVYSGTTALVVKVEHEFEEIS